MAAPKGVDWTKIRKEYISTKTSYAKLAAKYGLSLSAVQRQAAMEKWTALRKEHSEKVTEKFIQKSAERMAERLLSYGEIAGMAMDAAVSEMQKDPEFWHYHTGTELCGEGNSELVARNLGVFNSKLYSEIAGATEKYVRIFRSIYGLPTAQEAEAMRIAAERLEMEKKRAASEQVDEGIQVVISGEAEEWAK